MTKLTYNRPYQYVEDLRLIGCYRSKDHAVFIGQGFADNAVAFVEYNSMLTQLESSGKVQHGDNDQLVTQRFDVDMPFRVYVVNPDDENGKASNAIEYTPSKDIPVLDVLVNGESVVKDQKAYVDISGKLNSIMKPNMIYGTDSDGKETQYKRQQIEGVQHFFLNGDEIPLDMGNIRITDIARESKSVQRVNEPLQLYGTNEDGAQATYPKSFFATSESVINAGKDIQNLKENKQDKDSLAKDGYIAVMKNGQSVGSDSSLDETIKKINDTSQELSDLTDNVKKISVKDWKSKDKDSRIENNPVGDNSIVISDKSIDDEKAFRETDHAIVYGLNPQSVGQYGTMVGSGNQTGKYGTTVGSFSSAKGDSATAIGTQSQSDGSHASALGVFANAQKTNSIAIGKGALSSADNATALGADSVADVDNTVSIGFETSDSQLKPQYRRLMAVDDPILDHDAVNKKYVDSKSFGTKEKSPYLDVETPIDNRYCIIDSGNLDGWMEREQNEQIWTVPEFVSSPPEGWDAPSIKNTNFLKLSKRECIANPIHVDPYDTYSFSCLAACDENYLQGDGKKFRLGYCVDVNPSSSEDVPSTKYVLSSTTTNPDFDLVGNFKRFSYTFTIPPNDDGYVNFRPAMVIEPGNGGLYVTDINIKKVSSASEQVIAKMPYLTGRTGIFTKVGAFVYVDVEGESVTGTARQIEWSDVSENIPYSYTPGYGFNAFINLISEKGDVLYIRLSRTGVMQVVGQFRPNVIYRGSTIYPWVDTYGQPNPV